MYLKFTKKKERRKYIFLGQFALSKGAFLIGYTSIDYAHRSRIDFFSILWPINKLKSDLDNHIKKKVIDSPSNWSLLFFVISKLL